MIRLPHSAARLASALAILMLAAVGPAGVPVRADSIPVPLHAGLPDQDRVGKLVWRGGIALSFDEPRFGGISAIEVARAAAR